MSVYVVDASVVAKWFFEEAHRGAALRLLNERDRLHAPDFLLLEFDSVVWQRIGRKELPAPEGNRIRRLLRTIPVEMHSFHSLLDSAFGIAVETRQSTYDCLYLSLAVSLHCSMVTADRKFWQAIAGGPFAVHVAWFQEVP